MIPIFLPVLLYCCMKYLLARKLHSLVISPLTLGLWLLLGGLPVLLQGKETLDPITPEDLAATECIAYPGASAEILLEKRQLNLGGINYFRRIKIYSPKGANEAGVVGIEYMADQQAANMTARLIKPNGTSVEFTRKAFTESISAKIGSNKLKRQILAVPGLAAGDILEMRWTETAWAAVWWYFQNQLPVRHFIFSLDDSYQGCWLLSFNLPKADGKPVNPKPTVLELHNIPPFVHEPYMPPTRDVRGWFLLLFVSSLSNPEAKGEKWEERSTLWEREFRQLTKPSAAIKEKVVELLKGVTTDDEKIRRLYDFCQQEVGNFDYFESAELQAAKKKYDAKNGPQYPAQTLKLKTGESHHLNELFASLAKAAGFEVRLVRSANRNATLFVKHPNGWLFVPDDLVNVKVGQSWRYYAPGDYYVPAGMLDSSNESTVCLVTDPKKLIFETTSVSNAGKSPMRRKGRFVLDAEGNLDGEVEISMGGHEGIVRKRSWRWDHPDTIDAEYRSSITKRLPAAEVNDLKWENLTGNKLPLIARYRLRVPGYADMAGSKIILPVNVFAHGDPALFSSETRKHPVFFSHAWSEHDDIEIQLPAGYTLEEGSAPDDSGDPAGILGVRYDVGFKPKSNKLVYQRDFALGGDGSIAFQTVSYPDIKRLFDSIQRSDEHTVVLKPK